jgi:hypothetical protein
MGQSDELITQDIMDHDERTPLETEQPEPPRPPFKVKAHRMGLRPGLSYDSIEALLAYAEGLDHK